ncbi:hypothetical protein Tco_0194678 [Tanacetum coccineum]
MTQGTSLNWSRQSLCSRCDRRLIELENQVQRLIEAHLALKQSVQVNKITSLCEICSGPQTLNIAWKIRSKLLLITHPRITTKWEVSSSLQTKDQEALTKPLMLRRISQTLDGNPSSQKRVHFINSIVILNKESEAREEENMRPNATMGKDHNITIEAKKEVEEESKEEFEEETEKEIKEEEEEDPEYFDMFPIVDELRCHEWLMKNPRPLWEGLKVFVGNFTYECDFVVLDDIASVIDHYLGGIVLGRPFVKETGLVYDKDERTVTFEKEGEKIIFKMPHKMEMFKHIDKNILKTNNIPSFIMTGDDGNQKNTHYSDSLNLGPAYRRDESVTRAIRSLIKIKSRKDEG